MVVGLGQTADGLTSDVEVIDLFDPALSCNLPNFPYAAKGAVGFESYPVFCGGHNSTDYFRECYSIEPSGNTWEKDPEMVQKRWGSLKFLSNKSSWLKVSNAVFTNCYQFCKLVLDLRRMSCWERSNLKWLVCLSWASFKIYTDSVDQVLLTGAGCHWLNSCHNDR